MKKRVKNKRIWSPLCVRGKEDHKGVLVFLKYIAMKEVFTTEFNKELKLTFLTVLD